MINIDPDYFRQILKLELLDILDKNQIEQALLLFSDISNNETEFLLLVFMIRLSEELELDNSTHSLVYKTLHSYCLVTDKDKFIEDTKFPPSSLQIRNPHHYDSLTRTLNRQAFLNKLTLILQIKKKAIQAYVVCYFDIDHFRIINTTASYNTGDTLLIQVSELIENFLNPEDFSARLGNDKFGILLKVESPDKGLQRVEKLMIALNKFQFSWGNHHYTLTASIGMNTFLPNPSENAAQLLLKADEACAIAKNMGGNQIHEYQTNDFEQIKQFKEYQTVIDLQDGILNDRLQLYFQPILLLNAKQKKPPFCELLVRMLDENNKIIPPGTFIPAAEHYGLMVALDRWVVKQALNHIEIMSIHPDAIISINLSAHSLSKPSFLSFVEIQLAKSLIPAEQICFEITETSEIQNLSNATRFISEMQKLGCLISLDDFGSGCSSFIYLKRFNVNYLKVDGSFIQQIKENSTDHSVVAAICLLANRLGIQTVAESVENKETIEILLALGIDFIQGYAVGKPQPLSECSKVSFDIETALELNS